MLRESSRRKTMMACFIIVLGVFGFIRLGHDFQKEENASAVGHNRCDVAFREALKGGQTGRLAGTANASSYVEEQDVGISRRLGESRQDAGFRVDQSEVQEAAFGIRGNEKTAASFPERSAMLIIGSGLIGISLLVGRSRNKLNR